VSWHLVEGSFRDPSGFVYTREGTLYRQVNRSFAESFDAFTSSGLYDELARDALLVPHQQVGLDRAATDDAHAVLQPERIEFISYPYEWSFSQLKDAAELTLDIQERALNRGFTLRDSSAYNVQFHGGRPIFIDTLSFERLEEGKAWSAYKQFCEHFLVPLTLMSARDIRCETLLRSYIDGIPLDLGSRLLPRRSWLKLSNVLHIHLHAMAQNRYSGSSVTMTAAKGRSISSKNLLTLVKNLRSAVQALSWQPVGTEWADYVTDTNYSDSAARSKREIVQRFLRHAAPRTVWDVGANTGEYSRAAAEIAPVVISFDIDPAAVERNYRRVKSEKDVRILPLLLDLSNPSPAQGWAGRERLSLEQRGPADVTMALALIHHLAIGNNLPLDRIAAYFSSLAERLIIEFVPKSDSQVKRLLLSRPDIFPAYTKDGFESAFRQYFTIEKMEPIPESERCLYLMAACQKPTD
jgi:ribosomal protein L11 methylase PrmA